MLWVGVPRDPAARPRRAGRRPRARGPGPPGRPPPDRSRPTARRLALVSAGALARDDVDAMAMNGAPDLFVLLPFAARSGSPAMLLVLRDVRRGGRDRASLWSWPRGRGRRRGVGGDPRTTLLDLSAPTSRQSWRTQPPDAVVVSLNAPQVLAISGRATRRRTSTSAAACSATSTPPTRAACAGSSQTCSVPAPRSSSSAWCADAPAGALDSAGVTGLSAHRRTPAA